MVHISVLKDFSEFPGLRNCSISDDSGELFYHKVLNPQFKKAYETHQQLEVDLDNTGGYASSFLDEAFGNLVYDFTLDVIKKNVIIISQQQPHWKDMIEKKTYLEWEKRRKENERPKVTVSHEAWYRLQGNQLVQKIWEQPVV